MTCFHSPLQLGRRQPTLDPARRLDRAVLRHEGRKFRARRFRHPGQICPRPPSQFVAHRRTALAEAQRGGDMIRGRRVRPGQIGNRPRDSQGAVDAAHAELSAVERGAQRRHRGLAGPELVTQRGARHLGVRPHPQRSPPSRGGLAGRGNPGSHRGRRLPYLVGERTGPDGMHLDLEIDAVHQRARQLAQVAPLGPGVAQTVLRVGGRARARVRRHHQLEPGRIPGHPVAAGEPDLAVLQRGSQRLQHTGTDLGAFVEEQHAAVRPADRTRAGHPGTAAHHRRHRRGVVRGDEGRPGDQRGLGRPGCRRSNGWR